MPPANRFLETNELLSVVHMEGEPATRKARSPRQRAGGNSSGDLTATTVAFFLCSSSSGPPQDGAPRPAEASFFDDDEDDEEYDSEDDLTDVSALTETDMENLTIGDLCAESHARFQMEQLATLPPMFAVEPVEPAHDAATAPPSDDEGEGLPPPSSAREIAPARGGDARDATTIEEGAQTPPRPATTDRKPPTLEGDLLVPVRWLVSPPMAASSTDRGGWGTKPPLPPALKAPARPTTLAMEGATQIDVAFHDGAPEPLGRGHLAPPGVARRGGRDDGASGGDEWTVLGDGGENGVRGGGRSGDSGGGAGDRSKARFGWDSSSGAEGGGELLDTFAALASGAADCVACGADDDDNASVADERAARA